MFAMTANGPVIENDLVDWTVTWLRERLPATWAVERSKRIAIDDPETDAAVQVQAPGVYTTIAVEAKRSLAPREVERLLGGIGRTLRTLAPHVPILVVAPWLSARARTLLRAEGLNYLDQTGNASIRLETPALFIQTEGAARDPAPTPRGKARLRGPKAGRLIRTLVDVRPPYGVRELAGVSDLAPGYVSRLLDALDEDALIERGRRGRVERTDVRGLLKRWAETYDVFKAKDTATFVAPGGAAAALSTLTEARGLGNTAVTGSFAAVRYAPVAAPALLAVYSDNVEALARDLALLPTDEGTNVALLRPFDPVVWERTHEDAGIRYAAPAQIAVDCLTGTGRMPAEGKALVAWMLDTEDAWRRATLPAQEPAP
jgi:hypothetical protein